MKRVLIVCLLVLAAAGAAELSADSARAKNVILFIGDGTGLPTLHAASIHGYGKPNALYIQSMPHMALMETSSASSWVSDSAAGMTAIVTGEKTHNGVLSQAADAERGQRDGKPLKTILEHAEERGLASGVVSNSAMSDATSAACYAQSNDRDKHGMNFAKILKPRFGDGADVVIGPGRPRILQETADAGIDLPAELPARGYIFLEKPEQLSSLPSSAQRVVALFDSDGFDLGQAVGVATTVLSRNDKGFFLMVESNNHFGDARKTLDRAVMMDRVIRETAERMKGTDTLILFAADHSYGLRISKGRKGEGLLSLVEINGSHTAEDVVVTAEGPGAERVRGFFPNTQLFHIMMAAYGWKP